MAVGRLTVSSILETCHGVAAPDNPHAGSRTVITDHIFPQLIIQRNFFLYTTIRTIIWYVHNINAISNRWTWCASVKVYSRTIQGVPSRGTYKIKTTNGCYRSNYVLTSTNVGQIQLTTLGWILLPCSSLDASPYAS